MVNHQLEYYGVVTFKSLDQKLYMEQDILQNFPQLDFCDTEFSIQLSVKFSENFLQNLKDFCINRSFIFTYMKQN